MSGPGKLRIEKVGAQNVFTDFLAKLDHSKETIFLQLKTILKGKHCFAISVSVFGPDTDIVWV